MFSFFIFIITLFLIGPLVVSLGVFRFWFPKHTLKINQAFLLPLGIPVFILGNLPQLVLLLFWLPERSYTTRYSLQVLDKVLESCWLAQLGYVVFLLFLFIGPAVLTAVFAILLKGSWSFFNKAKAPKGKFERAVAWIGKKVNEVLISYMGQLTAYDKECEELMVDVYTTDKFLFCGRYSDYYIGADGTLQGISITNVIRHRIEYDDKGERVHTDSYLVPNQGEMFFPTDKIINFHIWKLKEGHIFYTRLGKSHHSVVLAWYLAIKLTSKINVRVKLVGTNFEPDKVKAFLNQIEKLGIDPRDSGLEFDGGDNNKSTS